MQTVAEVLCVSQIWLVAELRVHQVRRCQQINGEPVGFHFLAQLSSTLLCFAHVHRAASETRGVGELMPFHQEMSEFMRDCEASSRIPVCRIGCNRSLASYAVCQKHAFEPVKLRLLNLDNPQRMRDLDNGHRRFNTAELAMYRLRNSPWIANIG